MPFTYNFPIYGAKRIRTADPLNAIEVLYQLSYNPLRALLYSLNLSAFVKPLRKKFFSFFPNWLKDAPALGFSRLNLDRA